MIRVDKKDSFKEESTMIKIGQVVGKYKAASGFTTLRNL